MNTLARWNVSVHKCTKLETALKMLKENNHQTNWYSGNNIDEITSGVQKIHSISEHRSYLIVGQQHNKSLKAVLQPNQI
jgi:bifunctional N-acetylglucosamine-1-phosphate-uridyltransferase/glucosamine-1-phosphate-acetyltransferase GlmU-like protein